MDTLPFDAIPPEAWDELLRRSGGLPDLPPEPVYQPPVLAQPPASTFRTRLADALASLPPPAPAPLQSPGQAAVRGLLSGASRGFAGQTRAREGREERVRQESNALARAESDRNWQSAQATYRAQLVEAYRTKSDQSGKVLVTKPMAEAMGSPSAAGFYRDPVEIDTKIRERKNVARVPADLAETMGMTAGAETTPAAIMSARQFLKPPKPENAPPPGVLSDDQRRGLIGLNAAIRSDPDIKDFVIMRDNYKRMTEMTKLASGQGDLSIIFSYMKVLDPTSVVREAEYNNAAEAVGKLPALANVPNGWLSGKKLTPAGRQGFIDAAASLYNAKKQDHDRATAMYSEQARALGVDPALVLRDYSTSGSATESWGRDANGKPVRIR